MTEKRCKACGRPESLHKQSARKVHEWPRIMCSAPGSFADPKMARRSR